MSDANQLILGLDKPHRNEYLFSDHYLESILRRDPLWVAAQQPAAEFLAFLREHYAAERNQLAAYNEAQLEENWIKPILSRLGHVWEPQASVPGMDKSIKKPDYVFFPDDDTRKAAVADQRTEDYARRALAVGEVKAWPVSLSRKTAGAPTFDNNNPMFQIDYYLKATGAAWGIASNGRFWRLVHKDSSYRLDRYFEIDLLAALNTADERRALAVATYFTLFFGRAAFARDETGRVFLDDVLKGSQTYAVALESDLRDNAYKALEQIILGFFAPAANGLDPNDEADRAAVYRNSLLLLYRLLFLFFGESRGLLPMGNDGYRDRSLTELAKRAAKLVDDHKVDALPPMTGTYWARYKELFAIIDGRDAALNAFLGVPRYNGGLFDPQRHAFLESKVVGERHLVRAIDYLARRRKTENGRFTGYEAVDYRTLGVRQLGSIYEGLLEYKVSVAAEEMVTVRKGGKETWLPARERGKTKVIETKQPGDLYLATDKGERKATGSYYTPDYIVKYIVEQTLGPLVEEARRRVTSDELRVTSEEGRAKAAQRFVDEILSLNVLDPAMGSGHFLVDATNYLARALATSEWGGEKGGKGEREPGSGAVALSLSPLPPFSPSHEKAPAADEESDLTYWKRRVVEACIYGVDKNELAVELAKLSLWLETVAADKPLSFLDHHLRHGDSLIGARLADLARAPGRGRKGEREKGRKGEEENLFDESAFTTDAFKAVSSMALIERVMTDDLEAVHSKERVWQEIYEEDLGRWRRLADLWVSAWFGNDMSAEEYRDLALRIQGKPEGMLSDEQAARYLDHPAATDNDYFHWELEFPEVFFDAYGRPKGEKAGFDAVVGNPPYDELSEDARGSEIVELGFLNASKTLAPALGHRINIYRLFIAKSIMLTRYHGWHSFIVPMSLLADQFTLPLRRFLLESVQLKTIEQFPQKDDPFNRVFLEAKLSTCLYVVNNALPDNKPVFVRTHEGKEIELESPNYSSPQKLFFDFDKDNLSIPGLSADAWALVLKMSSMSRLGDYADAFPGELMINAAFEPYLSSENKGEEVIRGSHISLFELVEPKQGQPIFFNKEKYIADRRNSSKAFHHQGERLVYQRYAAIDNYRRLIGTILPAGRFCSHTVGYLENINEVDKRFLLALFNSSLLDWRFNLTSSNNNINGYEIEALPVPLIRFDSSQVQRKAQIESAQENYNTGQYQAIPYWVISELIVGRTDTIHDFLAYLADQMIAMHKEKQALTADFWTDLEGASAPAAFRKLRDKGKQEAGLAADAALAPFVRADSKSARTLDDALAWDEAAFKAFVRALAGPVDGLSRLVKVYNDHAPRYRELVERIGRTDRLIDQIVYKLYGLTDEEIAIVEGRG